MALDRTDPELLRQLDEAERSAGEVQAVFNLRHRPSAEEAETAVRRLLERVRQATGVAPRDFNVFRNLGAFVVVAPAAFVRSLMEQAEVATATANRQPEGGLIPPRRKRPA